MENSETAKKDFFIDYEPYNDADFWVNNIGNSMSPEIENDDIIALKEIKD
jgi:phage repressor protein C with HTH and peptisase S24 domain